MERRLAHLLVPQRPVGSPQASLAEPNATLVLRGAKELSPDGSTGGDPEDLCLLLPL